ncbi:MAG TPA: triose-phosphate isomerase [Acidobacteriota bacterium]|nr:triose-phosphate isomerase [Acidobacteriota bacterium]
MRTPVIAGNWKMHKLVGEAQALTRAIKAGAANVTHCQVVLAPPFTALTTVAAELRATNLILAAQNVHWEPKGAFTGEISIPMLEDVGCGMVIVGHSERRQFFGETDQTVSRRVRALLKSSLQPIVCIGETLSQREAGDYQKVIMQQLTGGLDGLTRQDLMRIILAYEPVWAIGTGRTASPEIAQEVHGAIRSWLSKNHGEEAAQQVRILYGGSVKPDNISDLMRQPDIDGALVGGACLEAESFLRIIHFKA